MKKLIALILSLTCLVSLAACSSESNHTEATQSIAASGNQENTQDNPFVPSEEADDGLVTVYVLTSSSTKYQKTEYSYDENGRQVKAVLQKKNRDGEFKVDTTTLYQYDENGNLVDHHEENSEGMITHYAYQYDNNGNVVLEIREFSYDGGETIKWHFEDTMTYDENGNLLEFYEVRNETPWLRYTYTYDENGRMTEEYYYDPVDELMMYQTIEYTENTEKAVSYWGGRMSSGYKKTYDDNGNLIRSDYYYNEHSASPEESDSYDVWTYDAEGRVLESAEYENGKLEKREVHIYCPYGETVEYTLESSEGPDCVFYTHVYTYDQNGNLIQKDTYYNDSPWNSVEYTYAAIRVTPERAEELKNGN